jgi:ribonucleoside-triphosphate reductase
VSRGERMVAKCPNCGSKNVYGMSRVVGYFSRINNWNKSKQAEFKSRQKGVYDVVPCECEKTE